MAVNRWANLREHFTDGNGALANGYRLFFYASGSTTKQNTYNSSAGSVANSNPITLNARGEPAVEIWLTAGLSYKVVLAPAGTDDPPSSPVWTEDVIVGINDVLSTVSEWLSGPTPTFVSATSFTLVGDQTSTFTLGRRCKFTVTAGTVYGTIINSVFGAATTITMKMDAAFALDAGLSSVFYGLTAAAHPSIPQATVNAQPVCNGRLTLTTGTAVTTSDVTAATSVFFTPFHGNTVDIYDGSANWNRYTFSELTLAVPAAASQMYDVFLQNNAGTLQLNAVAWTNDTTRATALVLQNGVLVKSGATSQLYLGSFRTTTVAGQTEDSAAKRYVWNYYNRVKRYMSAIDTTDSWTYTTATFRQANGSTANQLDCVIGVAENAVSATVMSSAANSGSANVRVGIGINVTNANSAQLCVPGVAPSAGQTTQLAIYSGVLAVGRNFLAWLEYSAAVGTTTWYGDNGGVFVQSGIMGEVLA